MTIINITFILIIKVDLVVIYLRMIIIRVVIIQKIIQIREMVTEIEAVIEIIIMINAAEQVTENQIGVRKNIDKNICFFPNGMRHGMVVIA